MTPGLLPTTTVRVNVTADVAIGTALAWFLRPALTIRVDVAADLTPDAFEEVLQVVEDGGTGRGRFGRRERAGAKRERQAEDEDEGDPESSASHGDSLEAAPPQSP